MPEWKIRIPEETDRMVREFLARTGKSEELAAFVDDAVRAELLKRRIGELKAERPGLTDAGAHELATELTEIEQGLADAHAGEGDLADAVFDRIEQRLGRNLDS